MIEPRELAQLALANKLPPLDAPDALPAIKEAMAGIQGRERVSDALRAHNPNPAIKKEHPGVVRLHTALKAIGAKLAPAMVGDAALAWRDGVAMSLRGYTVQAAIVAAEKAQGEPFQYGLGSVDARLHELAKTEQDRDAAAIIRLRMMAQQIERAQTQKALPAPRDEPMTVEEIAATPDAYIALGRKLGFISDEEYDAAMAWRDQNPVN